MTGVKKVEDGRARQQTIAELSLKLGASDAIVSA